MIKSKEQVIFWIADYTFIADEPNLTMPCVNVHKYSESLI